MSVEDGKPLVPFSVDDVTQRNLGNTISRAITDNVYGINHRQIASAIPINKDQYGLTFFTKPQLNFTTSNLRNVRLMIPLLSSDDTSYQRAIRTQLDPRLMLGYDENKGAQPILKCPLTDPEQAFIPLLTNNLLSISGWPDILAPTFTSEEGVYKEAVSYIDGVTINYSTYDITATFRNLRGDPINSMFFYWLHYAAQVNEGNLLPYPDLMLRNEYDYNTRIYRLVLDSSRKYVQRIAASGASFPMASPFGGIFDFNSEKPYNDVNAQLAIPFRCMGAIYNDDILVRQFNDVVKAFKPAMRDDKRDSLMIKISNEYLVLFNNRGYPRIDPESYELQWWIEVETFKKRKEEFDQALNELHIEW